MLDTIQLNSKRYARSSEFSYGGNETHRSRAIAFYFDNKKDSEEFIAPIKKFSEELGNELEKRLVFDKKHNKYKTIYFLDIRKFGSCFLTLLMVIGAFRDDEPTNVNVEEESKLLDEPINTEPCNEEKKKLI